MKIILDSRTDTLRIVTTRVRFDEMGDDDAVELAEAAERAKDEPLRDVSRPDALLTPSRRVHPRFPELSA